MITNLRRRQQIPSTKHTQTYTTLTHTRSHDYIPSSLSVKTATTHLLRASWL